MVLQLFVALTVLAGLMQGIKVRRLRVWELFLFFACSYLAYRFYEMGSGKFSPAYLMQWLPYKGFKANLNLSSSAGLVKVLLPLLGIMLFLQYQNLVYNKDSSQQNYNAMLLLGIPAFILLFNSHDFVQLLSGSCCFTLISFYLINQPEAREKSLYYYFFAEMCLFTALAIVFSGLDNINLSSFERYLKKGRHKDLIAVLVLAAIFAKSGLFLFQNKLLDLQKISFPRLMTFCFMGNPLAAMLLFVMLRPLWSSSELSAPIIQIVLAVSLLWGFLGALLIDSLKAKALYLNLMFYAFCFALLFHNQKAFEGIVIYLLPLQLLLNYLLYSVVLAASDEVYVSEMGSFFRPLKLNYFISLAGIAVYAAVLQKFMAPAAAPYFYAFGGAMLVALAHIFYQIYFAADNAGDYVRARLSNLRWIIILPLVAGLLGTLYWSGNYKAGWLYAGLAVWVAFSRLGILRFLSRLNDSEWVQEADLLQKIYSLFIIAPVRVLGRVLWLSIDFVIIERTIIGSISQTTGVLVRGLQRVQNTTWINYLFMLLLGLGIIVVCVGYRYE